VREFVNADPIASGLSLLNPGIVELAAGRIMLGRLRSLAAARLDFAFETTLASRSFAPWLASLRSGGYRAHLTFLSLPSAELAVARVSERVRQGGHAVPEEVIRRRFVAGLRNLMSLHRARVDSWRVFDNADDGGPLVVASGQGASITVHDAGRWQRLQDAAR
jgi:predicted ABC-type ATPase